LSLRTAACLILALACCAAADSTAARLAHEARQAEDSGHLVRAYFLYAEAAAREPGNSSYRTQRDLLAPIAQLLTKATVENAPSSSTSPVTASAGAHVSQESPLDRVWKEEPDSPHLQPPPHLEARASVRDFDLRGDDKTLFAQVASAYGIHAIFDPELHPQPDLRFTIDHADFRTAMKALTDITNTFIFPVSSHTIFVARDTLAKRNEYEPDILVTVPLPEAMDPKQLIEAANAVRATLGLRTMAWDSINRTVQIRDHVTRANIARNLLEALLLPKGQVSIGIEFLTVDKDRSYHYGLSLPTAFQLFDIGHIGAFQSLFSIPSGITNVLAFGGGATLFGVGLTNGALFAQYSNSFATNLYNATVVVADGQTAQFHVGDKYPIPQAIYTGYQQTGAAALYNPIGQVTLVDLGLKLKISPRISGDGDIALDIEADYNALGAQTFNTVPVIAERTFKGSVRLREGEWAILAGLDTTTQSRTRSGLIGLSQIPGLNQILSENTRDTQTSNTLIVIKPTITRLPMASWVSPQYLLGPQHGERVLL
jgi:general secretion pathway protein D